MRQVTDMKYDSSISTFIKVFRQQLYDQAGILNYNIILRKASFLGFCAITNFIKTNENVSYNK